MTERELAQALRADSPDALAHAIRTYTAYVSAVAFRAMGGRDTAEDLEELTADVFLALWEHRSGLDPERGLRAYLAATARNKATDLLRKQPGPLSLHDQLPDPRPTPEEAVLQEAQAQRLYDLVQAMDEPDRSCSPMTRTRKPRCTLTAWGLTGSLILTRSPSLPTLN